MTTLNPPTLCNPASDAAVLSDAAAFSDIWLQSFTSPFFLQLFPRIPSTMDWSINMNTMELADPRARFLKITSSASSSSTPPPSSSTSLQPQTAHLGTLSPQDWNIPPNVVAFAKWQVPLNGVSHLDTTWDPTISFPPSSPSTRCKHFFEYLLTARQRIMGNRPHYFLEVLATRPEWQRMGAGGMLIQWGVEQADNEGLECYIEASPDGLELYKRWGWEEVEDYNVEYEGEGGEKKVYRTVLLVRKPRGGKGGQ